MAPDFNLPTANGVTVSLKSFRNKQAVLILFYRDDWCPYCIDQLSDYQELLPELEKYTIQLIALSQMDYRACKIPNVVLVRITYF